MSDMCDTLRDPRFVLALANDFAHGHMPVLSVVMAVHGSMPRDASAAMALLSDGTFVGTVGGGKIEAMVQERSLAMDAEEATEDHVEWYTHAKTGMACGGDALVGIHRLSPADSTFLARLIDVLESGEQAWTCIRWPEESPAELAVHTAPPEPAGPVEEAPDFVRWYPEARTYVEDLGQEPVVYIFGAGHVARALVPALSAVGFGCEVADDRPELAVAERFPLARAVRCGDFVETAKGLPIGPRDYVVVMTHGHVADLDVLKATMARHPSYTGCIGSRTKRALFDRKLEAAGIPADEVAALHLPIGDDIGAVTPAEIAVSVAAELIRHRANAVGPRP